MRLKISILAFSVIALLISSAGAQMPDTFMLGAGPGGPALQTKTAMVTMRMDAMDAAPVKGAPFCATVTTEHTQSLADGNRIHTTDSSMLCRDGEGRTRREAALNLMGGAPQTSAPKLITIVDPVAKVRYLLDTESKIAQKMPLMMEDAATEVSVGPGPGKRHEVHVFQRATPGSEVVVNDVMYKRTPGDSDEPAPNTENLADQTIEGIHVTGTRVTTTIPAGKMGNEKPITVTSERWYSPELKVTVMSKHDDPWAGELKTEFKNVNSAEPDPSLFSIPAGYTVVEDKEGPLKIRLRAPGPEQ